MSAFYLLEKGWLVLSNSGVALFEAPLTADAAELGALFVRSFEPVKRGSPRPYDEVARAVARAAEVADFNSVAARVASVRIEKEGKEKRGWRLYAVGRGGDLTHHVETLGRDATPTKVGERILVLGEISARAHPDVLRKRAEKTPGANALVKVRDQALRRALAAETESPLTRAALASVVELHWDEYHAEADASSWEPIDDLSGIEHCKNCTFLGLDGNAVEDLSPLRGLPALRELWLVGNGVTDVSPLENLTALKTLNLEMNGGLRSIAPIAELPSLEWLDIEQTDVRDITPLLASKSLRKLDARIAKLDVSARSKNRAALVELVRRGVEISCHEGKQIIVEAKKKRTRG